MWVASTFSRCRRACTLRIVCLARHRVNRVLTWIPYRRSSSTLLSSSLKLDSYVLAKTCPPFRRAHELTTANGFQDPSTSSFIASGCTGLVLLVCTVCGTFYIDRVGRRKIWLVGGTATAFCHFVRCSNPLIEPVLVR